MSYCRFSNYSDVYLIASGYGGFQLYTKNSDQHCYGFETRQEVLDKLLELKTAGLLVPESAIKRIKDEIDQKLPEPQWDGYW